MPRRTLAKVETVVYKGIVFRRYPEAKRLADRNYFRPNSVHIKNGVEALHREIWRDNFGEIPKGCQIHHKDGDPANNDISNLECLTTKEHRKRHMTPESIERLRKLAERGRMSAPEWHASAEGREWHRQHAINCGFGLRELVDMVCEQCGGTYQSGNSEQSRFCSNNCKAKHRRASGVDEVSRTCAFCGNDFQCNKYMKTKCCSESCAAKLRWQQRKP